MKLKLKLAQAAAVGGYERQHNHRGVVYKAYALNCKRTHITVAAAAAGSPEHMSRQPPTTSPSPDPKETYKISRKLCISLSTDPT